MSITLYGEKYLISPYVLSCFVALKQKVLPFELKTISLGDKEQLHPSFARSLTAKVPALEHDGFWLAESSAIVEYLEDAFPAPKYVRVLPEAIHDRARARQLMAWIRSDLMPIREERSTNTIFYEKATTPLSPAGRAAADKLLRVAGELLPRGKTHLFGTFTVADVDLALMLQRLIKSSDDVPAHLRDYADAQWAHPSVKEFVDFARPAFVPY
jgi:glutathione S-transferase